MENLPQKVDKYLSNILFYISLILIASWLLICWIAIYKVFFVDRSNVEDLGKNIINSISLVVVAIAIIDVAKYMIEQEVLWTTQTIEDVKHKLIKFCSVIFVAIMLEALLAVFIATKQDISLLIYPSFLILSVSIFLIWFSFMHNKLSEK